MFDPEVFSLQFPAFDIRLELKRPRSRVSIKANIKMSLLVFYSHPAYRGEMYAGPVQPLMNQIEPTTLCVKSPGLSLKL